MQGNKRQAWGCIVLWYDIYWLQFLPGDSGRPTCTKMGNRQLYREGETAHKTIPKHRILKIGNNIQTRIKHKGIL